MIRIKTNISKIIGTVVVITNKLSSNDIMLRTCATTVLGMMKKRIHEDGKDATGKQIGTYSTGYMKVRTGNFQNSGRKTKGAKKGELKNSGVFSKGESVGQARPKFNRTPDTKVVLSLTRQMENDMKVIPLRSKTYGIGYSNKINFDKSQWCEATYTSEGKIFSLSGDEKQAVNSIVQQFTDNAIS